MRALLVYADGRTELRHDGGGNWWLHEGRYFWGWKVACEKFMRDGTTESAGTIVYLERPKSEYEQHMRGSPS